MLNLKGTSWQQRYAATGIYTLRCKALDKPGMFAKLSDLIGKAGANLGDIATIDLESEYKIRDITIFTTGENQLAAVMDMIGQTDGLNVISVRDEVLETHRRGSI